MTRNWQTRYPIPVQAHFLLPILSVLFNGSHGYFLVSGMTSAGK